jgi:succinate dehydrogenase / fumarate reductase cytochrome b subunit
MSSLGKKYIMALTGLVLVGFAAGHMVGNLQMFLHPDWINEYAYKLQHLPYGLLWVVRLVLLACVVAHVLTAVLLVVENHRARPEKYVARDQLQASFASRTMRYSGVILLAFIVFHILHFTVQSVHPEFKGLEARLQGVESGHGYMESRTLWGVYDKLSSHGEFPDSNTLVVHDVHTMVRLGFSTKYWYGAVPVFYILSMGLLCFHLSHGISSMFQSMGLRNAVWRKRLDRAALVIALVVFVGFASLPLAGLLGMIDPNPFHIAAH